jgi:hypothetical protein
MTHAMSSLQIFILVGIGLIVLAAVIAVLVFGIIAIVRMIEDSRGGWRHLVKIYATLNHPPGQITHRQTVKIGAVTYKRCANLGVADEGLYVTIYGKSALIPWQDFTGLRSVSLYWQKVPELTIGDPEIATIAIPTTVFEKMRGHISARLIQPA